MSESIQKLREQRQNKLAEAKALVNDNPGDKWTDEMEAKYTAILADVEKTDKEIGRIQKVLDAEAKAPPGRDTVAIANGASRHDIQVQAKKVYRNLGEQLMDVHTLTTRPATPEATHAAERFQKIVNASGLNTGIDQDGGYLVETDSATGIIQTAVETGVLSSRCTRQQVGANSDGFSYLTYKDRDRSAMTMMGGIDVYRKGEATLLSSSGKPVLEERELRLEDMYGLIYVTNRMLRDAVALAGYVKTGLQNQLAWKLDYEIFQGTGAGQCLGFTNSGILVSVTKEANQTATTIVAENVAKMLARFKGNVAKACWFVNQDCLAQFPLMTIGNMPVFVPGGELTGSPYGRLFGIPIVPIEFCATLGTTLDIILGDFSQYILIEKGSVELAQSMHVRFLYDETAFRFVTRNNGQPIHDTPITPLHGSNTLSPFVSLDTRS